MSPCVPTWSHSPLPPGCISIGCVPAAVPNGVWHSTIRFHAPPQPSLRKRSANPASRLVEEFFSFRNFRQFERTRHEIRLPHDLINDLRFRQLPDASKAHVVCLLLVSARMRNLLPNHPVKLERLIGATEPIDLGMLADFIELPSAERGNFEEVARKDAHSRCGPGRDHSARWRALPQVPQHPQPRGRSHRAGKPRRSLGGR